MERAEVKKAIPGATAAMSRGAVQERGWGAAPRNGAEDRLPVSRRSLAALPEPERSATENPCRAGSFPLVAPHNQESASDGKREALLERALVIQEETLGPEHLRVAITLTQLMFLYRRQGKEPAAAAAAARATMILASHTRHSAIPCG